MQNNIDPLTMSHNDATKIIKMLTARQYVVVCLLAQGNTHKQIAEELGVAKRTISSHAHNACNRAGAITTMQIVAIMTRSKKYIK